MATNFEFHKDKLINDLEKTPSNCMAQCIAKTIGIKANNCAEGGCEMCYRYIFSYLAQEHIEPPKLTKRERAFCETVQAGWIARDEVGKLHLFDLVSEPYKQNRTWLKRSVSCNHIRLNSDEFAFVKWEDEKPWSVEDLLKLEVLEEPE